MIQTLASAIKAFSEATQQLSFRMKRVINADYCERKTRGREQVPEELGAN
jgi:hypothetical protein